MNGNVFLSLNTETWNDVIPMSIVDRYGWSETDSEGNTVEIHPTWEELANSEGHKRKYGSPVLIKVGRRNIYIVELTASFINSEVSDLVALGAGLEYPQNTLLTAEEAQTLINENS